MEGQRLDVFAPFLLPERRFHCPLDSISLPNEMSIAYFIAQK